MKSKNGVYSVNLLLCVLMLFGAISCKKDKKEEECVPPALAEQIVRTWTIGVATTTGIAVTFSENGEITGGLADLLATNPLLADIDPLIKYEVKSDTAVDLLATKSGVSLPVITLNVTERTCEKIVLSTTGYTITLTK